jgi:hypothetical protein
MDTLHGKLLAEGGDSVVLDDVVAFIGAHRRRDGSMQYYGSFDVPDGKSKDLDDEKTYRLVLDDGRSGQIVADVHPCPQKGTLIAEFHVTGSLRA